MSEEKWITIQEYSEERQITLEAARQAVRRYKKELQEQGHLKIVKHKTMLDEEAVKFLSTTHHRKKPMFRSAKDIWDEKSDSEKYQITEIKLNYARRDCETYTNLFYESRKENGNLSERIDELERELSSIKDELQESKAKYRNMKERYYSLADALGRVKNILIERIYDPGTLREILNILDNE